MILGAILAGGASSRFGSDKALALLDGRSLIDHVAAALAPHVAALIVCGRTHRDFETVADRPAAELGPLGGLNGALHHAARQGFDAVVSLPCDTPVLPPELLPALIATRPPAMLADCPVIGIWPATLADRLDRFLAEEGSHAMRRWAHAVGAQPLPWPAPRNVNRPADLLDAAR